MNQDIYELLTKARAASRTLLSITDDTITRILLSTADALMAGTDNIIKANAEDLALMDPEDPKYDRLRLTPERIAAIAADMRAVATLPSPLHEIDSRVRPNGLVIRRIAVPFGVIGVIYEARPNVTADVFSLCLRSHNACVLKGGHDADHSNRAIITIIRNVLEEYDVPPEAATLLPADREATAALLEARGLVDLIIPRGSRGLIDYVRSNAKIPVIETGAGVCHCYVHSDASVPMATDIVCNAKTRRVSVCNALDCLLIHQERLTSLADICAPLAQSHVKIHADARSFAALRDRYPAELLFEAAEDNYGTEFLGYEMSVRTVDSLDEAIRHIDRYGSGHSESIVTDDPGAGSIFQRDVDAACVYVNAPTSFTDGAQFGLGAEIGISTQKLHARGPMALAELTTYKWLINGEGQTRQP